MLPRLQAEEMLAAAHVGAMASGNMKAADMREAVANLKRAAGAMIAARRQSSPAGLGAMGIGVHRLPKKEVADAR